MFYLFSHVLCLPALQNSDQKREREKEEKSTFVFVFLRITKCELRWKIGSRTVCVLSFYLFSILGSHQIYEPKRYHKISHNNVIVFLSKPISTYAPSHAHSLSPLMSPPHIDPNSARNEQLKWLVFMLLKS